jgi:hypothetical protein
VSCWPAVGAAIGSSTNGSDTSSRLATAIRARFANHRPRAAEPTANVTTAAEPAKKARRVVPSVTPAGSFSVRMSADSDAMPATAAAAAVTNERSVELSGTVVPATKPGTPNATKPRLANVGRVRATLPRTAPKMSDTTTMPITSAGLSFVPSVSIAHRSTAPGVRSIARSPRLRTREGAENMSPAMSSETARASAAARIPARAYRRSFE